MKNKIRIIGIGILVLLWAGLTAAAWFGPVKELSEAERRPLAQMPELSTESILDGSFMADFEGYSLDQFPLRDSFRRIKALFHYHVLGQSDSNDIYLADRFAVQQEYPLAETSIHNALRKFNEIYESYLKDRDSRILMAIVPDKGYYLAESSGHLALDYETLFAAFREGMPWAEHVDITQLLSEEDYYFTDTHWRQEKIMDVARHLCEALEVNGFDDHELVPEPLERPFYGVYYGQAALPMEPETMYVLRNEIIDGCTVYDHESGKNTMIYDMEKLESRDLYDVYLSGARALLTIENPSAGTDRELIVFRDSFGSSLIPLLVKDYRTVTVVDIRYVSSSMLGDLVDFHGQDVLLLYSTLILNNSSSLK